MPAPARDPYTSRGTFVEEACRLECQGTTISFNEPTLSLGWSLEVFRLARRRTLHNTIVTNGYMAPDALALLIEAGLDAINVDMEGGLAVVRRHSRGIDVEKTWRNRRAAVESRVHLEVTTLVIPGVNDGVATLRETAERIISVGRRHPRARQPLLPGIPRPGDANAGCGPRAGVGDREVSGPRLRLPGQCARPRPCLHGVSRLWYALGRAPRHQPNPKPSAGWAVPCLRAGDSKGVERGLNNNRDRDGQSPCWTSPSG